MRISLYVVSAGLCVLAGCAGRNNMPQFGTAATQAQPGVAAAVAPLPPSAPYALSAHCAGPFISFNVANQGTTPLQVKREHFALLVPSDRKVVPYDQHTATIDLPRTEIAPGETLQGRAFFKEFPAPTGHRLVYKPDTVGTYAEVIGAPGV